MKDLQDQWKKGFLTILGTYIFWGFLPGYWKLLQGVTPFEIICHRIIWSVAFLIVVISALRGWDKVLGVFHEPRTLMLLFLSGIVIGCNWLTYVWAINTQRVLEASLGYYINPLVNVIYGFIFFHDRPRKIQWISISLAMAGVLYQVVGYGQFPVASIIIAVTFATYGLIRKIAKVDSIPGLFIETLVLTIPALIFIMYWTREGVSSFSPGDPVLSMILIGTGLATSLPLITFVYGARRLSLVTVGLLQYFSPTITFCLGIFLYHEPLNTSQLVTFICIWSALALYSVESIYYSRYVSRR